MKIKRSCVAMLLAVLLLASTLAGCGTPSETPSQSPGQSSPPASSQSPGNTASSAPSPDSKPEDWGLVRVASLNGGTAYESDPGENEMILERLKEIILENCNALIDVEVIYLTNTNWQNEANLMILSGQVIDVLPARNPQMTNTAYPSWTEALNNYGQNILAAYPEEAWQMVSAQGQIYGLPRQQDVARYSVSAAVRKDLLDKWGLKMPETWDDLEKCLARAYDEGYIPIYANAVMPPLFQWFITRFPPVHINAGQSGGQVYYDEGMKAVNLVYLEPGFLECMKMLRRFVENDWLSPDVASTNAANMEALAKSGRLFMAVGQGGQQMSRPWIEETMATEPDAQWLTLPYIGMVPGQLKYSNNSPCSTMTSKNLEGFIKYMDYLMTDYEAFCEIALGLEGVHAIYDWDNYTFMRPERYKQPNFVGYGSAVYTVEIGYNNAMWPRRLTLAQDPDPSALQKRQYIFDDFIEPILDNWPMDKVVQNQYFNFQAGVQLKTELSGLYGAMQTDVQRTAAQYVCVHGDINQLIAALEVAEQLWFGDGGAGDGTSMSEWYTNAFFDDYFFKTKTKHPDDSR